MEDLPLGRIAALVPEFAVKDLPLGKIHGNDDDDYDEGRNIDFFDKITFFHFHAKQIGLLQFLFFSKI